MQEKEKGRKRKMRTKATKKESEIWELINKKKKKKAGK